MAIATLFSPLQPRVQEVIDRRFFRNKFDVQRTLAAFAETARDETDLEALRRELVSIIVETIQPETVIVWL